MEHALQNDETFEVVIAHFFRMRVIQSIAKFEKWHPPMQTRNQPRKNYTDPSDDESTIHSSEEKEYNSESTEHSEQVLSQDRQFIVDDSIDTTEHSFQSSVSDYESDLAPFRYSENSSFPSESINSISTEDENNEKSELPCFDEFQTETNARSEGDNHEEMDAIEQGLQQINQETSETDDSDVLFLEIIKKK